ncbi:MULTISPECIES: DEAD/DEAH box helicase [Planktothricoides]|uniref:ATP-binding domain-containing protein n=1 Tax=Planktothricoides raciborskii FACHB-1370 TaxID=2949576 RepID=A0ABR8EAL8_9CYAN|nr:MULTISPECIES: ATP-binding domain-containing protein [Planktothricoides]KOR37179.1 DNA/RNA helicase [Planktothricoides sp. SR001]MBD2542671.1 ATP-binding domain-containing protein [Planktothricoides raciborskii FACHB-1370]MBD2581129.1 ATP-binding domain-containing protein [Planktothricoides raciborskii FACHB-1261]
MPVNDKKSKKFINTEPIRESAKNCEEKVWDAVKTAFADRECIGYWRYPLFAKVGEVRKEPDILIGDQEIGVIIIEIACVSIDQIVAVNGEQWELTNRDSIAGSSAERGNRQLQALLGYCDRESVLFRKVTGLAIVALPLITQEQWQQKGFDQLPGCPPILFQNQLGKSTLLERIKQATPLVAGEDLDEEKWQTLKAVIGGTPVLRKPPRPIVSSNGKTRSSIVATLQERLYELDLQQEEIGKQIPPGVQRIRGIAGSGKTVLLCQKAAHMHLKHPDWDIALVFFTRALYDQIEDLVNRWLRRFSNGDVSYDATVQKKLKVLHAWGARDRAGLYRTICQANGITPLGVRDSNRGNPNEKLADICGQLLNDQEIQPMFDAILIDEGQDLVTEEDLKYQEDGEYKQAIYWMAYQALRPIDPEKPDEEQRRLIWAYDEAQSLDSLKIPTAKELFGDNLTKLVTGRYKGDIKKSEVMKRCYRTPGPILTAAHAIGMGLLRPQGMLAGLTNKESWQAIGYEIKQGSFNPVGQKVTLNRPPENSPNPIPKLWEEPVLEFETYDSRAEELEALAAKIKHNLSYDGLKPSRDILVVVLGSVFEAMDLETQVASFLMDEDINIYIPTAIKLNQLKPQYPQNDPDRFWQEGGVTISRIHRAKGNEANMVYVVGLDNVAKNEQDPNLRNQLFVGLTRSRGWACLSGIGNYDLYDEMRKVITSGDTFTFTYKGKLKINRGEEDEN